jgi:tetratricopeptide (TPR) repeat protein
LCDNAGCILFVVALSFGEDSMANTPHPAPSELVDLLHNRLEAQDRSRVLLHLARGCAACQQRLKPWVDVAFHPERVPLPRTAKSAADSLFDYDAALGRMARFARRLDQRHRKSAQEVRRFLAAKQLPGAIPEGPEVDERLRHRCRVWLAAVPLIRQGTPESYESAARLLVAEVTRLLPVGAETATRSKEAWRDADLAARLWGELANAERLLGRYRAAEESFRRAMDLAGRGHGDVLVLAGLFDLAASLWIAERRFDKADEALGLAHRLYLDRRQHHLAGKALYLRGIAAGYAGKFEPAISHFCRAYDLIDADKAPDMAVGALSNAILFLADLGDFVRADRLHLAARPVLDSLAGPVEKLKLRAVAGKIAAGLGRLHQAEAAFRTVRREFTRLKLPMHASLAGLELCAIWLHEGRTAEAKAIVEETLATFIALGIEREALASLVLLDEAVRQEQATVELAKAALREAEGLRVPRPAR